MDNIASIAAGGWFSLVIKTDGSLWAWGSNNFGQLGDGTTEERHSPVKIMDGGAAVAAPEQQTAQTTVDDVLGRPSYIYDAPTTGGRTRLTPSALNGIGGAGAAREAIETAIGGLSAEEKSSGDALDDVALFIEKAISKGASKLFSGRASVDANTLGELSDTAAGIISDAKLVLERDGVHLLRELRSNVSIAIDATAEADAVFSGGLGGAAFDYITLNAPFASLTVSKTDIESGGEMRVINLSAPRERSAAETSAADSEDKTEVTDGTVLDKGAKRGLSPIDFWGLAVVIPALAFWGIMAALKKKLPVWAVPTVCAVAIIMNAATFTVSRKDKPIESEAQTAANRRAEDTPAKVEQAPIADYAPVSTATEGIQVIMSAPMRATLSLPVGEGGAEKLALFNERGELMYSKYNAITGSIEAHIRESGVYTLKTNAPAFVDIDKKPEMMKEAIEGLSAKGIMSGTTDGFFYPDKPITRAEFASAIVRAFDLLDPEAKTSFTDVDVSDWYYGAVASAEKERIVSGFEDGTFRGTIDIPKVQLVVMAANTLRERMGYVEPSDVEPLLSRFIDRADLPGWSEKGAALATEADVLIYREDSRFAPDSVMTRGDAAIVLWRVFMKVW